MLCWNRTETKRLHGVKLINAFSGNVVLELTTFESNRGNTDIPCSYGRILAGRYLTLLDSEGKATIWDLREGREIASVEVAAYPDLQGLQVVLLDGQVILLPKRRLQRPRLAERAAPQTTDGKHHVTIHALHAISLDDGKLRWSKEFETPWGCTVHQPAETPILVLSRSLSSFNSPTSSRRQQLDAMAIDVRDGTELDKTLGKPVLARNNVLETRLTIQPGQNRVIAQLGGELLTYKFDEDPAEEQ